MLVQIYQGWIQRHVGPIVTQPNQDITTRMSKGWENASDEYCAEQTSTRPSEQRSPPGAFLWRQGLQQKNKSKKKSSTGIHVRTVPKFTLVKWATNFTNEHKWHCRLLQPQKPSIGEHAINKCNCISLWLKWNTNDRGQILAQKKNPAHKKYQNSIKTKELLSVIFWIHAHATYNMLPAEKTEGEKEESEKKQCKGIKRGKLERIEQQRTYLQERKHPMIHLKNLILMLVSCW